MTTKKNKKLSFSNRSRKRNPSRSPKPKITVVCEGTLTEPRYLKRYFHEERRDLIVEIDGNSVDPSSLVRKEKKMKMNQKRNRDSYSENDQIWVMFDVDGNNINTAIKMAEDNGIPYVFSNPCFELWALLHFCDQDAPITTKDCQSKLRRVMPDYSSRNKIFDYDALQQHYAETRERALRLCDRRQEEGTLRGNPSTNVVDLLELELPESLL